MVNRIDIMVLNNYNGFAVKCINIYDKLYNSNIKKTMQY